MKPSRNSSSTRRAFIKKSALGIAAAGMGTVGLSATGYKSILGAGERLNVALVGCGRRFPGYIDAFTQKETNAHIVYVCDVMKSRREAGAAFVKGKTGYTPEAISDFRKVLSDKDIDALFVAVPDHWHAPATWMALEAGKHVYVEKPLTHNPQESEWLLLFREKYGKLIQMGNQQRSAPDTIEIIKKIHQGIIGTPYLAVAFYTNARGRVKNPVPASPPQGLDWALFQGPAPHGTYMDDVFDYNWHWYGWNFGTAETGNNATHELDIGRWALQLDYPETVIVTAGKEHFPDDGWSMYDTMDATFRFQGGKTIKWDGKSRNGYKTYGTGRGTIIYGSEGTVYVDRDGFKRYDRDGKLLESSASDLHEEGTAPGGGGGMTTLHIQNFFNAIRGKDTLHSPVTEGAKSTLLCHLANIAYRTGETLHCNTNNGHIQNEEAMRLWGRTYEPGWKPVIA